ncbi:MULTISPECIES: hypothetical protein [Bacillus cereus group]|uniref:hypothetical protein n=1 Tax=Bacillus cereus group TaxID=86661 RepID=UPI000BEBFACE|nr:MULTISPECIES: hypothetical protein [Bacillus cereus group]MBJ8042911.1 hypothetical protein [Bacillus cereus group sp. N17]PEC38889.1 hypothetical protein CON60_14560 [Bacillus toyonensis]PED61427.1 hypothetical protein CON89_10120 [Bacillus toyonensis]PEJ83479.1 hypothetical protein CN687_28325 [Bacillus toyonensis]PEK99379.1 hypothetical protein CN614_30805 [Bacillus toyonensis]
MTEKEHIQKTIVESIVKTFDHYGYGNRLGESCVYASYLTKDLLKEKYNLDAELVAGELDFSPRFLPFGFIWNPPYEFHMWAKLNGEIIDIAPVRLTSRDEFKPGGKFHLFRNAIINVVWEKNPLDNRIYREVKNGVKRIDPPEENEYKKLYKYASDLIDSWNSKV